MIEEGTHDYGRADRSDQVKRIEAEYPGVDMVTMPTGALMPRRLADRGNRGWQDDRDVINVQKITRASNAMDAAHSAYMAAWLADDQAGQLTSAEAMAAAWSEYREATGRQA